MFTYVQANVHLHQFIRIRYSSNEVAARLETLAGILQHHLSLRQTFKAVMKRKLTTDNIELNASIFVQLLQSLLGNQHTSSAVTFSLNSNCALNKNNFTI